MTPSRVAILCCAERTNYRSIPGTDCWDVKRDVRTFRGGCPVVAHPPCRAWSAFTAHQAKPLPGEKELGPLCVSWLLKCGGVLEHPAHSRLWKHCGLPLPGEGALGDLWATEVLQSWWPGHKGTQKNTWLCFSKISRLDVVTPITLREPKGDKRLWRCMPRSLRSATCSALAHWLVETARKVNGEPEIVA